MRGCTATCQGQEGSSLLLKRRAWPQPQPKSVGQFRRASYGHFSRVPKRPDMRWVRTPSCLRPSRSWHWQPYEHGDYSCPRYTGGPRRPAPSSLALPVGRRWRLRRRRLNRRSRFQRRAITVPKCSGTSPRYSQTTRCIHCRSGRRRHPRRYRGQPELRRWRLAILRPRKFGSCRSARKRSEMRRGKERTVPVEARTTPLPIRPG